MDVKYASSLKSRLHLFATVSQRIEKNKITAKECKGTVVGQKPLIFTIHN